MDRYEKNPLAYDNRGAEPTRPLPEARRNIARRRRAKVTKVIVSILVVVALATLWHTQTKCDGLIGNNSSHCVD